MLDRQEPMSFSFYIVECADGTYYTGIASDVQRRMMEHNGVKGRKGKRARYTAARRPVRLVFEAAFSSRSEALKEEARIKRLTRQQKEHLIVAASRLAMLAR